MKQALYKGAVLTCDVPEHGLKRGDIVKLVDHHVVFNAVGDTIAVTARPQHRPRTAPQRRNPLRPIADRLAASAKTPTVPFTAACVPNRSLFRLDPVLFAMPSKISRVRPEVRVGGPEQFAPSQFLEQISIFTRLIKKLLRHDHSKLICDRPKAMVKAPARRF